MLHFFFTLCFDHLGNGAKGEKTCTDEELQATKSFEEFQQSFGELEELNLRRLNVGHKLTKVLSKIIKSFTTPRYVVSWFER